MEHELKRALRVAERRLIVEKVKCRWLSVGWGVMLILLGAIVTGGVLFSPEIFIIFSAYLPLLGGMLYASGSDDGPYADRRRAQWRVDDLREELSEEIVRSF